ncbi:hypothetical protein [Nonomuraea sp. NPDC003201]
MPTRRGLLRVVWLPGSDLLQGTCHCGAVHVAEGPVEVWEWLLGHPTGHNTPTDPTPPDAPTGTARTAAGAVRTDAGTVRTDAGAVRTDAGMAGPDALSGAGAVR